MEGHDMEEPPPPAVLVKLTRTVVKYFYQPKDLIVVDWIIKEKFMGLQTSVSENKLEEMLKFDVKLLRVTLATLKNDRILTMKTEKELDSDGKRRRINYYFIKYGQLVNVVKYKLENVRIRLETLERELSSKTSFICARCGRKFTDLEAGELFNTESMKFCCLFCRKPVMEDTTSIPADTRDLVAKFNEQIGPLYDLIREAELYFQNQ